jgi:hypothetical protein
MMGADWVVICMIDPSQYRTPRNRCTWPQSAKHEEKAQRVDSSAPIPRSGLLGLREGVRVWERKVVRVQVGGLLGVCDSGDTPSPRMPCVPGVQGMIGVCQCKQLLYRWCDDRSR